MGGGVSGATPYQGDPKANAGGGISLAPLCQGDLRNTARPAVESGEWSMLHALEAVSKGKTATLSFWFKSEWPEIMCREIVSNIVSLGINAAEIAAEKLRASLEARRQEQESRRKKRNKKKRLNKKSKKKQHQQRRRNSADSMLSVQDQSKSPESVSSPQNSSPDLHTTRMFERRKSTTG